MDPNLLASNGARMTMRHFKQSAVDERGIGADIQPHAFTAQLGQLIGCYELDAHDRATSTSTFALAVILSDCDLVIHGADVYLALDDRGGDLTERFASGDPNVMEGLVYVSVDRELHTTVQYDPYEYEGKRIVWMDGKRADYGLGRFAERTLYTARHAFRHQRRRNGPALLTSRNPQILNVGHSHPAPGLIVTEHVVQVPCPCGSGIPAAQCCAINN